MIQNKNIKLIFNYFGGPLVFCILLYSIYNQLHQQADWQTSLEKLDSALRGNAAKIIVAVVCLMMVNWGIEAAKWKTAINITTPVSFGDSLKAIFSGNAMAFFTPNRTGEYFGRMLYLRRNKMIASVPLTIICSIAQIIITLFTGCAGLIYLREQFEMRYGEGSTVISWLNIVLYLSVLVGLVLTIIYFNLPKAVGWLKMIGRLKALTKHLAVLEDVNATILLTILSLSIVRYLVFIVQYFLLFRVFGVEVHWWQAFWSVSTVFLVIAAVPSIGFLSELGIRWQASIQIVQLYSSNITGIFATSLSIWMINLTVPAVIGGFLILALKLFRKQGP